MIMLSLIYNKKGLKELLPPYFKKHILYLYDEWPMFIKNPYLENESKNDMDIEILPNPN